jgi:hypothetical protein
MISGLTNISTQFFILMCDYWNGVLGYLPPSLTYIYTWQYRGMNFFLKEYNEYLVEQFVSIL